MTGRIRRGSGDAWQLGGLAERADQGAECSSCGGTGFMAVVQPKELGRRIFPPRCPKCEGKGKIAVE
jgi:DnaJ-class molecular chaperone